MKSGPPVPPGVAGEDVLAARSDEALALWGRGEYLLAEDLLLKIIDGYKDTLGHDHPSTLNIMASLASVLCWQGKYAEAEILLRKTLQSSRRVLGEDHPSTLATLNDLGLVLNRLGKYPEVLGEEHARSLTSMVKSAMTLSAEEKFSEAEIILRQTLEIYKRIRGMDHPKTLDCMKNLSLVLGYQGKFLEAEEMDRVIAGEEDEGPERFSNVCYLNEMHGYSKAMMDPSCCM